MDNIKFITGIVLLIEAMVGLSILSGDNIFWLHALIAWLSAAILTAMIYYGIKWVVEEWPL